MPPPCSRDAGGIALEATTMATRILTVCDHCGTVLEPSLAGPCGFCGGWEWRYVATTAERTPLRFIRAWVRRQPGGGLCRSLGPRASWPESRRCSAADVSPAEPEQDRA
jgi:hypothetical protein